MNTDKETGSYYTPYELVRFMVKYLNEKEQDFSCVLEPSVGDGRVSFCDSLRKPRNRCN